MIKTDEYVTAEIKLYYDLYVPKDLPQPAPVLISVHGYAAHKKYMMREAQLVAPEGFAIASLEAPNRFWRETKDGGYKPTYGWLTEQRAEDSIALHRTFTLDVIDKLVREGVADPERVFLYGFSQSCALNFRFAFSEPHVLRGLIGVCGGIPTDLDSNENYRPAKGDVLYLYTTDDEFYPIEKYRGYAERLSGYLPSFESKEYRAAHVISDEMRKDLREWLENKIKDEDQ